MIINTSHLEAMKELVELCKKHGMTIYPADGVYSASFGLVIMFSNGSTQFNAPYISKSTESVTVPETVAISASSKQEEA